MIQSVAMLGSLVAMAAAAGGTAQESTDYKIIVGDEKPQFHACYQNAADGGAEYEFLKPCEAALASEDLSPRDEAIVYVNRGVIYYNLGEYDRAVEDFSAALDHDVHAKAKTLVNRGLSYEALGADRLARFDYAAALAYNADNPTALRRLKELEKPLYERSRVPSRINAGPVIHGAVGI
ncbi:MAG: tetratricopeptide repeat protein [Parvularculaceae bacterium]